MEIWQIILSSALVSSILSSVATWLIGNHAQNKSFKNDYYKLVINKRMEVYQHIDNQLKAMKITTLDDDAKAYHSMFYGDQKIVFANQHELSLARANGIWLSNDMENALSDLNKVLFEINQDITDDIESNVALAKMYYTKVADTREKVEKQLRKDMLELYKVKRFLKEKKKTGYIDYQVKQKRLKES